MYNFVMRKEMHQMKTLFVKSIVAHFTIDQDLDIVKVSHTRRSQSPDGHLSQSQTPKGHLRQVCNTCLQLQLQHTQGVFCDDHSLSYCVYVLKLKVDI